MHVVRSPVTRAAPAIEAAPGTVEHATPRSKQLHACSTGAHRIHIVCGFYIIIHTVSCAGNTNSIKCVREYY